MPCRPPSFRPVSPLRGTARCALLLIAVTVFSAFPSERLHSGHHPCVSPSRLPCPARRRISAPRCSKVSRWASRTPARRRCRSTWPSSTTKAAVEGARDAARRIADGDALAVIGPSLSAVAPAVEPIYAEAGLAVVAPNIATDATSSDLPPELGAEQGRRGARRLPAPRTRRPACRGDPQRRRLWPTARARLPARR